MRVGYAILGLALAAFLGPATVRADVAAGEQVYRTRCSNCHSLTAGQSTIAPDLSAIVGQKAGKVKGYEHYTVALSGADFVWTAPKLTEWLAGPHNVVPETEMVFPGLKSPQECADVVEFLQQRPAK